MPAGVVGEDAVVDVVLGNEGVLDDDAVRAAAFEAEHVVPVVEHLELVAGHDNADHLSRRTAGVRSLKWRHSHEMGRIGHARGIAPFAFDAIAAGHGDAFGIGRRTAGAVGRDEMPVRAKILACGGFAEIGADLQRVARGETQAPADPGSPLAISTMVLKKVRMSNS